MEHFAQQLVTYCRQKGLTLFFAESMSCGLLATKLSNCIGTSDVLMGGIVCYNQKVKINLAGISKELIDKHTPESQRITDELVKASKELFDADIYAAITGLASQGGSETTQKPVGTVFFSMLYMGKIYRERKLFKGTPLEIKSKSCLHMYQFILNTLMQTENEKYQANMDL